MTSSVELHSASEAAARASSPAAIANILVVVDPTVARPACLDKAVRLAVKFGAHLELFVCDTVADCPESLRSALSLWDYRRHLRIRRLHALDALAEPLRLAGLTVHTSATWCTSLTGGIVDFSRHVFADWVIKDRDDTSGTQRLLSPGDASLATQLPGSLLLVQPTAWPESPRIDVVFGDEGGLSDERLVDRAASLAARLGGKLDLSNRQRPSLLVMAVPSNPHWTKGATAYIPSRLQECDLLLMKLPRPTPI